MPASPGSADTGFTLASAHWPDVAAGPRRLLVVPVGSLEQHGPHLPLDTDTRIATAVAARACAGRAGVGLAPAIAIGASGEHADFPGTLSIGSVALSTLLVELGRHASLYWPAMLLVNGHGGNIPAVTDAVQRLRAEGRDCHAWHAALRPNAGSAPPSRPGDRPGQDGSPDAAAPKATTTREAPISGEAPISEAPITEVPISAAVLDAHAGRMETSIMLALASEDVRLDTAAPGDTRPLGAIMPDLQAHGVRHVSPNGVLGDPTGASAAEGERLVGALVTELSAALDRILTA